MSVRATFEFQRPSAASVAYQPTGPIFSVGEDLRSLGGKVVNAAGAGIHLAGAGGISPGSDGAVTLGARNRLQIEMVDRHAELRSSGGTYRSWAAVQIFPAASRTRIGPGRC